MASIDYPTIGGPPPKSPWPGFVAAALIGGAVVASLFWIRDCARGGPGSGAAPAALPGSGSEADAGPRAGDTGTFTLDAGPGTSSPAGSPAAGGAAAPLGGAADGGTELAPGAPAAGPRLERLGVTLKGPLETAVVDAVGRDVGTPLTQVINRSLVWWLRVPQDLTRGDALAAVFEQRVDQEPLVHAVRFTSRKLGKTLEAYRFQPAGAPFPRYFHPDGSELEEHLVDGPIDAWEQITSLLRDGRRHKGIDFKAPVGSPVKATFDGVVIRKNWNFQSNGNSLEIRETGGKGRTAIYLHLSELPSSMALGTRVRKGQLIATSGNTGRSFAPHLHYQLMLGGRVVDPFDSHATRRPVLPAADRPAFEAAMRALQAQLGEAPGVPR